MGRLPKNNLMRGLAASPFASHHSPAAKPALILVNIPIDSDSHTAHHPHFPGDRIPRHFDARWPMNISPGSSPLTTILLIDDNDKDRTYYAERIRIGIPATL